MRNGCNLSEKWRGPAGMSLFAGFLIKKVPSATVAVGRHSFACGTFAGQGHSSGELSIKNLERRLTALLQSYYKGTKSTVQSSSNFFESWRFCFLLVFPPHSLSATAEYHHHRAQPISYNLEKFYKKIQQLLPKTHFFSFPSL